MMMTLPNDGMASGYYGVHMIVKVNSIHRENASPSSYVLDSGAGIHCWTTETPYEESKKGEVVTIETATGLMHVDDWAKHSIFGWGVVVPNLGVNLVSWGMLDKNGFVFGICRNNHFETSVSITHPDMPKLGLVTAWKENLMYLLHNNSIPQQDEKVMMINPIKVRSPVLRARSLHHLFGHPSEEKMLHMIHSPEFSEWQLTPKDIRSANVANCPGCKAGKMVDLLEELGFRPQPAIVFQDNQSCITLSYAGPGTTARSRAINIKYFWVKQFIDDGRIVIQYRPSEDMLADGLTKPLPLAQFERFRAAILNLGAW
jgi:hypothetical protein